MPDPLNDASPMVPTSQEDGVSDLPAKRVLKLSIGNRCRIGQIGRWSCLRFVFVRIIRPWLLAVGTRVSPSPLPLLAIPPPVLPRILQWQVSMVSCLGPRILIWVPPPCSRQWLFPFVRFNCCARSVKPARVRGEAILKTIPTTTMACHIAEAVWVYISWMRLQQLTSTLAIIMDRKMIICPTLENNVLDWCGSE